VTRRTRVVLGVVGVAVALVVGLLGTGAFIVLRNLRITESTPAEAAALIDEARARYTSRPPLIEIDPVRKSVHINRPSPAEARKPVDHIEIFAWQADEGKLVRTRAPLWLMRFSMMNVLSQFGLTPDAVRVTVDDVERYGQGRLVDVTTPAGDRALVLVQ